MFKKGLPIGTLVVILVIALAAIGVGYGLWSKVLFVSGTVATGNVNAEFLSPSTNDTGTDPGYTKDVGSCTVALAAQPGAGPNDLLTVTITNGYPSYSCTVSFSVKNSGSIPVMVQAFNFAGLPPVLDLTAELPTVGTQIDAGHTADGRLTVHVRQEAEESANYVFSAAITLVQWNEFQWSAMALCQKDENWVCVPGATGVLYYPPSGATFSYDFNAEGLTPLTDYSLIYYPEPQTTWPWPVTVIKTGTSDADGDLHLTGSWAIASLHNAKIWLVPSSAINASHEIFDWTHPYHNYLFEETLIDFNYP